MFFLLAGLVLFWACPQFSFCLGNQTLISFWFRIRSWTCGRRSSVQVPVGYVPILCVFIIFRLVRECAIFPYASCPTRKLSYRFPDLFIVLKYYRFSYASGSFDFVEIRFFSRQISKPNLPIWIIRDVYAGIEPSWCRESLGQLRVWSPVFFFPVYIVQYVRRWSPLINKDSSFIICDNGLCTTRPKLLG